MKQGRTPAVMVGMGIGDALGMPFEKLKEEKHEGLADWDGKSFLPGTFHDLPAGHWTDDTEMALCLAQSLVKRQGVYSGDDVAERYLQWSEGTPHGMGGSVKNAMRRLKEGTPWQYSGQTFPFWYEVGSGTAMRAAPIGVVFRKTMGLSNAARLDAWITHQHFEAVAASVAVASAVATLQSVDPEEPTVLRGSLLRDVVVRGILGDLASARAWDTSLRGTLDAYAYEIDTYPDRGIASPTLNAGPRGNAYQIVLTALLSTVIGWDDFAAGIEYAIRLGGDTDTRAAVAGAMLGALHGLEGIPVHQREGVKDFQMLADLDRALWELGK